MTFDASEHKASVLARVVENDDKPYRIRAWKPEEDIAFIGNSWKGSYLEDSHAVVGADREHYHAEMNRMLERLLSTARVLVACDREDETTLLGFAAATFGELHYVYVRGGSQKQTMRRLGIARDLVEALGPIHSYTFRTSVGARRFNPHSRGWKFTPRFTL